MTNLYDVIVRPVITERSMATTEAKKYTFEVLPGANKAEVKKAVEQIFGVKVMPPSSAPTQTSSV